jgi:hypothetical protein
VAGTEPRRFRLERRYAVTFAAGALLVLVLAAGTSGWLEFLLIFASALQWVLCLDAIRSGVWLRDDGLDIRGPLTGFPRRVGWREIDAAYWRPRASAAKRYLQLDLADGREVRLPRTRDFDELLAAIGERVGPFGDGEPT